MHYIQLSAVCPYLLCLPLTLKWKTIQQSDFQERLPMSRVNGRALLRSQDQGHLDRNV